MENLIGKIMTKVTREALFFFLLLIGSAIFIISTSSAIDVKTIKNPEKYLK